MNLKKRKLPWVLITIYIICWVIIVVFIAGVINLFAPSDEEKNKREAYFNQAKVNAFNYIKNKYGFEPEIGNAKCTYQDKFAMVCSEYVIVNASYNGSQWFQVYINGDQETIDGADNYQYQEISEAIMNEIRSDFGEPYKYYIYYGYKDEGIIDTYYNGNNLYEILGKKLVRCVVEYIDRESFENETYKLNSEKYPLVFQIYIVNYKSNYSYKKTSTHTYYIGGTYNDDIFYENADYLKDVITLSFGKTRYYDFTNFVK